MINENLIRENYSRMSDAQLIELAQTDGAFLTRNAIVFLYREFEKRSLDTSSFIKAGDDILIIKNKETKGEIDEHSSKLINSIWTYIFKEKEVGVSNNNILNGLLQRGFQEEQCAIIISNIENKAKDILATHNKNVLRGAIISLSGLAISVYTYSSITNSTVFVLASGAIVGGVLLLFKGVSSKSRYKTIVANIETERILSAEQANNIVEADDVSPAQNHTIEPPNSAD